MTNLIISKMVDGQEKGVKQVQSPTRVKGKSFYPNSPNQKSLDFGGSRHSKVNNRSPRSSPSQQFDLFGDTVYGRGGSPPHNNTQKATARSSPSKDKSRSSPTNKHRSSNNPRLSPSHHELYAGFSDSPEPTALPLPPSHWIFPHFSNLLLNAQA